MKSRSLHPANSLDKLPRVVRQHGMANTKESMKLADVKNMISLMQLADSERDFEKAGGYENMLVLGFVAAIADGTFTGSVQAAAKLITKASKHGNPRDHG